MHVKNRWKNKVNKVGAVYPEEESNGGKDRSYPITWRSVCIPHTTGIDLGANYAFYFYKFMLLCTYITNIDVSLVDYADTT